MRRKMKMMGMRVSLRSAMDVTELDMGLLARMGRYSERAACWEGGKRNETCGVVLAHVLTKM